MASLHPIRDRVIIKPIPKEKTTASGIVLPDTSEEKPQEGEVIAVGPGRMTDDGKLITPSVERGHRVLFKKYAPDEVEVDGQKYLILDEGDILAVLGK